mmetsp:Transcript_99329/g.285325  ORF Transcript_99329/g.285325 Transcript_99329/m.285325 type:complete len:202 (+) Transcript_99329:756-1361(+)
MLRTPPKTAKTSFTCSAFQVSGNPRTTIQGASSTSSTTAASTGSGLPSSNAAFMSVSSTSSGACGAFTSAACAAPFVAPGLANVSRKASPKAANTSSSPARWRPRETTKCNGPIRQPRSSRLSGPGWASPARTNDGLPISVCNCGKRRDKAATTSARYGPRTPCATRSARDQDPFTLPSASPIVGKAAIKPFASSCVLKRT